MRSILYILLVVATLSQSACMTSFTQGSSTQRFLMIQQKTLVKVQNNCAPHLKIESVMGVYTSDVQYGDSYTAVLVRQPFMDGNMKLTVKGYGDLNEYLGSSTQAFTLTADGDRQEVWEVNNLFLPNGKGGCVK